MFELVLALATIADLFGNETLLYGPEQELLSYKGAYGSGPHEYVLITNKTTTPAPQADATCHVYEHDGPLLEDALLWLDESEPLVNESVVDCALCADNPCRHCAFNLTILVDEVYDLGETIRFEPAFSNEPATYTLTYWWEDLHGGVVESPRSTENTNEKRYTPQRDGPLVLRMNATSECGFASAAEHVIIRGAPGPECPLALSIAAADIYDPGETITYEPIIATSEEYNITYWWEDLDGVIVREPHTTTNDAAKSYTPEAPEHDRPLFLFMNATSACNSTTASKLAVVRSQQDVATNRCPLALSIRSETLYERGETIVYEPVLEPVPDEYEIEYWLEEAAGGEVQSARTTTNDDAKRYTPPDDLSGPLIINMRARTACNESEASKAVILMGAEDASEQEDVAESSEQCVEAPTLTLSHEETGVLGEDLIASAIIHNPTMNERSYNLSLYLYENSANYTPRTPEELVIPAGGIVTRTRRLMPAVEAVGEYSIMTRAYAQGRKTPYEQRGSVLLEERAQEEHNETLEQSRASPPPPQENESLQAPLITGSAIKEPPSFRERVMKNSPWLSVLLAASLFLIARLRSQNADAAKRTP